MGNYLRLVETGVKAQEIKAHIKGGIVKDQEGQTYLIVTNHNLKGDLGYLGQCHHAIIDCVSIGNGHFVFNRHEILFRDVRGSFQNWVRNTSYHFVQPINNGCTIQYKIHPNGRSSLISVDQALEWGWDQNEEGWIKDFGGVKVISKINKIFPEGTTPIKGWWRASEREFVVVNQEEIQGNYDILKVSITPLYHAIGSPYVLESDDISSRERALYNNMERDEDGRRVLHTKVSNDFTLVVKGYC